MEAHVLLDTIKGIDDFNVCITSTFDLASKLLEGTKHIFRYNHSYMFFSTARKEKQKLILDLYTKFKISAQECLGSVLKCCNSTERDLVAPVHWLTNYWKSKFHTKHSFLETTRAIAALYIRSCAVKEPTIEDRVTELLKKWRHLSDLWMQLFDCMNYFLDVSDKKCPKMCMLAFCVAVLSYTLSPMASTVDALFERRVRYPTTLRENFKPSRGNTKIGELYELLEKQSTQQFVNSYKAKIIALWPKVVTSSVENIPSKSTVVAKLEALASHPYPTPDYTLLANTERAFQWTLAIDGALNPVWYCSVVLVDIEKQPFATGSRRNTHKLRDLTYPNRHYVAKFSTLQVPRDQVFMDVLLQAFSSKWADLFNSYNPPKKITFLPTFVLELAKRAPPIVCEGEPFIEGEYKKFSDKENERNTPQAFSHFTFMNSNKELVIRDIRGVNNFYTNPKMHTKSGEGFGKGNLGEQGINQFVKSHQCNPICAFLKLTPFNPKQRILMRGTLPMILDDSGNRIAERNEDSSTDGENEHSDSALVDSSSSQKNVTRIAI